MVALYNFHETIYNTIGYLDNRQLHLRGSPKAVAGGMFYLLTLSSSLYHLAFMSGQRFYAIKRPFKYRINNKTSVIAGILAIWTLSLLSASVPGEQCSIWSFANTVYYNFLKIITREKFQKNPFVDQIQLILYCDGIARIFSCVVLMLASCIDNYVFLLVVGVFHETKRCPVIIDFLFSFISRVCKEKNYCFAFKQILIYFLFFQHVYQKIFVSHTSIFFSRSTFLLNHP